MHNCEPVGSVIYLVHNCITIVKIMYGVVHTHMLRPLRDNDDDDSHDKRKASRATKRVAIIFALYLLCRVKKPESMFGVVNLAFKLFEFCYLRYEPLLNVWPVVLKISVSPGVLLGLYFKG